MCAYEKQIRIFWDILWVFFFFCGEKRARILTEIVYALFFKRGNDLFF